MQSARVSYILFIYFYKTVFCLFVCLFVVFYLFIYFILFFSIGFGFIHSDANFTINKNVFKINVEYHSQGSISD